MIHKVLLAVLLTLLLVSPSLASAHADPEGVGAITGRVTDVVTGAPLPNITVHFPNRSNPTTKTDADGRYRLANVPEGEWVVEFEDPTSRYSYEYYQDAPLSELAQPLTVTDGGEVTGIDAALRLNGRITGRVTDVATGAALGGVRGLAQYVWNQKWVTIGQGVTGDDGRYVIEGLPTDIYRVQFVDERGDHATTVYDAGAKVGVLVGEEVSGIDVGLLHEGRIAGQVTDQVTGAPLAGVTVTFHGPDDCYDTVAATAQTDGEGRYDAGSLAAGEYCLSFALAGYAAIYYGGTLDEEGSPRVTVRVEETTGGVNQALAALGGISGRVTDALTGAALGGIEIRDLRPGWQERTTGLDGTYAFTDTLPGEHYINFHDPNGVYRDGRAQGLDGSETIIVQPGRMTEGVDVALVLWANRTWIKGKVTDVVTGAALTGIRVALYRCYGTNDRECYDLAVTHTDAAGQYTFKDPPTDAERIRFTDPRGAYLEQKVTDLHLPAPDETVVVDAALERYDRLYGGIAGRVTAAATGEPLAGQPVCVNGSHPTGPGNSRCVDTEPDGTYRIEGLQAEPYKVAFAWDSTYGDRYGQWWYGGDGVGTDVTVTVQPNEITANIDGALFEQGRIAGTIRSAATGEPVAGATVEICGGSCDRQTTRADGTYLSDYLPLRAHTVRAAKTGLQTRYYRDAANWQQAEPITPTYAIVTAGIDISLPLYGYITGRVTAAESGKPLIWIEARVGNVTARTAADGTYTLGPLSDGEHQVRFWDESLWRRTDYSAKVTVKGGATTAGVDDAMPLLGIVRGRVVDADTGEPVYRVRLYGRGDYSKYNTVYTDEAGRFELPGLEAGTYPLRVEGDWSRVYVGGQSEVLTIAAETVIEGLEIKLHKWGELTGRVTDAATGEPVAGVWVRLYSTGPTPYTVQCCAVTGADGAYRFTLRETWTVKPVFVDPQARYHSQSYGGGKSLLDSRTATFTPGADTAGVDAGLVRVEAGVRVWLPIITGE